MVRSALSVLLQVLPPLEAALEHVGKLKTDHLREVKSMAKPPTGVVLVMEVVCIMFGVLPGKKAVEGGKFGQTKDDYWESAQRELLRDPRKLQDDMVNYDKDNIPDKVRASEACGAPEI